jgi:hypothetical protein
MARQSDQADGSLDSGTVEGLIATLIVSLNDIDILKLSANVPFQSEAPADVSGLMDQTPGPDSTVPPLAATPDSRVDRVDAILSPPSEEEKRMLLMLQALIQRRLDAVPTTVPKTDPKILPEAVSDAVPHAS